MARICLAASQPFITGICISIRIMSKKPSPISLKSSTASFPFHACVTSRLYIFRSSVDISMLISLSSARRTRYPERSAVSRICSLFFSGSFSAPGRNGSVTVIVLPFPSSLSISIVPAIWSTRLWTMAIPRPVPATLAAPNRVSLSKGS